MEKHIEYCINADGEAIAFTRFGRGPLLVVPPGWVSHLEQQWILPGVASFFDKLARGHTLLIFDKQGTGLSDRNRTDFSIEKDLRDLSAIIDAAGVDRCDLFGFSMGGPLAVAYAAENPGRVERLILYGTFARGDVIATEEFRNSLITLIRSSWGVGSNLMTWLFVPQKSGDPEAAWKISQFQRRSASAETAASLLELFYRIDVTGLLPGIAIPTLVVHRREDRAIPAIMGQKIAAAIPNAQFVLLEGDIHFPWLGDTDRLVGVITDFLGDGKTGGVETTPVKLREDSAGSVIQPVPVVPTGAEPPEPAGRLPYHLVYRDLLEANPQTQSGTSRVGLAQIGMEMEFLEERGDGLLGLRPDRVDIMRGRIAEMIGEAVRHRVNILLFPEMTVDLNNDRLARFVFDAARDANMYIVPGSCHDPDTRANVSRVIGPEGILWEQAKHIPAILSLGGKRMREGIVTAASRKVTIANTRYGRVAITICRDFLDMDLRVELKNFSPPVDIVLNPAFTPVTSDFEAAHLEARRSVYAYFFFCNVAAFGNSLVHSPEKGRKRRMLLPNKEGLLFKDIDLFNLRAERRKWEKIREGNVRFIQSTR